MPAEALVADRRTSLARGDDAQSLVVGRVGSETTRNEPAESSRVGPGLGGRPADPQLEALGAACERLDAAGRETVLRVARGLAGT